MRARLLPAVALSFSALLLLLPVFAWLVSSEAYRIHEQTKTARQIYQKTDDAISSIQAIINKGALMEQGGSRSNDPLKAAVQVETLRRAAEKDCAVLLPLLGPQHKTQVVELQRGLEDYWNFIGQILAAPGSKHRERRLVSELQSGPETVLELAARIDALNQANLAREEQQNEVQQQHLRGFAVEATLILLFLELAIAVFSTRYMAKLDKFLDGERKRAEQAESQLRNLSNELVRTQEEERKIISRELHDEVGQVLTGLRMELGTLSNQDADEGFRQRLESVKRLSEDALRSVRNLALLIRPSMLDDLGLEPALHWQAKQFSRQRGIPVSVNIEGSVDGLPEDVRLCLYRVTQEALTNCGKHANASSVTVVVRLVDNRVCASIQDDGRGFDVLGPQTEGLGLIGMTERVNALQGGITVTSGPGKGTMISIELPLASELVKANPMR